MKTKLGETCFFTSADLEYLGDGGVKLSETNQESFHFYASLCLKTDNFEQKTGKAKTNIRSLMQIEKHRKVTIYQAHYTAKIK